MEGRAPKSGYVASGALHAALLGAILFGFSSSPKFDDASESVSVDAVTQAQFAELMKGVHDAKPAKEPVEKPTPKLVEASAPAPPAEPAKIDPPPLKKIDDPGQDETPLPPPKPVSESAPPKATIAPPAPAPPQKEAAAPTPPLPPDDAEIDRERAKPDPKPAPTPPAPPTRPKVAEKPKTDDVAKFLEKVKSEEAQKPTKPKSGDATADIPRQAYDPNAIAKLIGQAKPSPTRQMASLAALGSAVQNAPRMSLSLSAALDGWLRDAYNNCWSRPPTMPEGLRYVAEVKISYNSDGSLAAQPMLLNPPTDSAWLPYSESAVRAVQKCNPLHVPAQYVPYFEQWRVKTVHFDPQDAEG